MPTDFTAVNSSMIDGAAVDGSDLLVRFTSSKVYRYIGAGQHYDDMIGADSVGRYLNGFIKQNFEARQE